MESGALYSHNPVLSVQAELDALERRWRRRLDMQQREAAKKAAASAATAAASCRSHFHAPSSNQSATVSATHTVAIPQETIVAQTASWLDRANAILASGGEGEPMPRQQLMTDGIRGHAQAVSSQPARDIQDEMIEVQRLIQPQGCPAFLTIPLVAISPHNIQRRFQGITKACNLRWTKDRGA
jgi:hypothetical protein